MLAMVLHLMYLLLHTYIFLKNIDDIYSIYLVPTNVERLTVILILWIR